MNEVLRFNPFICESFYSDEVILVEGPTEEIVLRGYLTEVNPCKDIFIVNCGTVNNIPFYQKIFSKFHIKYHVICDTDFAEPKGNDEFGLTIFDSGIQKSIYEQFKTDKLEGEFLSGLFNVHNKTFEPAHKNEDIPKHLRIPDDYIDSDGKPYNANRYWKEILQPNIGDKEINKVPIINSIRMIVEN